MTISYIILSLILFGMIFVLKDMENQKSQQAQLMLTLNGAIIVDDIEMLLKQVSQHKNQLFFDRSKVQCLRMTPQQSGYRYLFPILLENGLSEEETQHLIQILNVKYQEILTKNNSSYSNPSCVIEGFFEYRERDNLDYIDLSIVFYQTKADFDYLTK
ncbi:TPA: hypothetical protein ACG5KU_001325 [Streptococcus agalactiae]